MCEHLHYESVFFKELHNEQEYYIQSGAGAAVVSNITSIVFHSSKLIIVPVLDLCGCSP